jgi:branched-subunit amino acid ABC-type transport system permease component
MMGLGARMSGGCNIGAFLSGISVGNVSGWVWGCAALLGTVAGVKLRPVFGLMNPKSTDGIC